MAARGLSQVDYVKWWDDAKFLLKADYHQLLTGFYGKDVVFDFARLSVDSDDLGIRMNGVSHYWGDIGQKSQRLAEAVADGADPYVRFKFDGRKASLFIVDKAREDEPCIGVYRTADLKYGYLDSLPEEYLLTNEQGQVLIKSVYDHYAEILEFMTSACRKGMEDIYNDAGLSMLEDLAMIFSLDLIEEDTLLPAESVYQNLCLCNVEESAQLKDKILSNVSDFYKEMVDTGELESVDVAMSNIVLAKQKLDTYFSDEYYLLGMLSFRVSNIGSASGEVQTDDIARVSVLAEKDPLFTGLVGTKLDKWCNDESASYDLKPGVTEQKRLRLGAHFNQKKEMVSTPSIRQKAKERFGRKM